MSRLTVLALAWFAGLSLAAWHPPYVPLVVLIGLAYLALLVWFRQRIRLALLVGLAVAGLGGLALLVWLAPPLLLPPAFVRALVALGGLAVLAWLGRQMYLPPLVVLVVVALGVGRLWLADWRPAAEAWPRLLNQDVTLTGMVDEDPINVKGVVTVRLLVERVEVNGKPQSLTSIWLANDPRPLLCQALSWLCAPGAADQTPSLICPQAPVAWWQTALCPPRPAIQARINVDQLPYGEGDRLLRYGNRLVLTGKLREAPEFDLFPYRQTLARDGVYARLTPVKTIQEDGANIGFPPRVGATTLRRQLDAIIRELMPNSPREAGLLAGILLGLQVRLTDEMVEGLRSTSLSHIVVVSGFNIAILTMGISGFLYFVAWVLALVADQALIHRRFKTVDWLLALQRRCLPISKTWVLLHIVALIAYTFFVGLDPSPVRAALMGCVYVIAKHMGRPSTTLTSLTVTAWVITVITPWALLDIGFQLTFMAVLGLVLLQPVLNTWLYRGRLFPPFDAPRRDWPHLPLMLRGLVSTTLAATLMTAPIISYYFNQVSAIGLLANILALPVQAAIMFMGLGAVLLAWGASLVGGLHDGLMFMARLLSSLTWPLLRYTVEVILTLAQAPWAAFDWRASGQAIVFMYSVIGAVGLWLAFALRLVNFRTLFLDPSRAARAPATAAPLVPADAIPTAPPLQRGFGATQPTAALAERPGPPTTRWRRPAPVDAAPTRPTYRFGAPTTPVSRAPLSPVGDRPTLPAPPVVAPPVTSSAPEPAVVYCPPAQPVARQPMDGLGPHPRRPFDVLITPTWTSWFRLRYVVPVFALWVLVSLTWPLASGRPDGLLHLTLVTPGDTVVVRTPHGERMVIGGGSWASDTLAEADRGWLPWERRLSVVAATRLDRPYLEALNEVMARHPVRAAMAPPRPRTAGGFAWDNAVQKPGVTRIDVDERLPVSLALDGVSLEAIAYDEVEKAVLYQVRWGEVRFVLGGGGRGPMPAVSAPATVVLLSRETQPDLVTALARAYRPALWVVQTVEEGDAAPDWMDRLPAVLADRPITLTTNGQRLWLDTEPR
ncbi:MAG: ComEC/Rec2 family competence protein [Anaerolineae bacterium]|nr:ComEC/Rec2 family competence protein [Anaerolineae bacterium]